MAPPSISTFTPEIPFPAKSVTLPTISSEHRRTERLARRAWQKGTLCHVSWVHRALTGGATVGGNGVSIGIVVLVAEGAGASVAVAVARGTNVDAGGEVGVAVAGLMSATWRDLSFDRSSP